MSDILKDLLAIKSKLSEADDDLDDMEEDFNNMDMSQLLDKWMEHQNAYNWEGERGWRNLKMLTGDLGYNDIKLFFMDNPGAIQAILDWLSSSNITEYKESLLQVIHGED